MMKMHARLSLATVAYVVFAWPSAGQQNATGSLKCSVVDDIRSQPLQAAKLTLGGGKLEAPMEARTDSTGSFTFTDLPFSRYTLAVERSGYFPRSAAAPQDGGTLSVNIGASEATISVTLVKIRTATGTVIWQDGEPASEDIVVHALKVRRGQATFRPGDAYITEVKEGGKFKIENLRPGNYLIYAYRLGLIPRSARPKVALPVFYPDSLSPEGASSVDLTAAADASSLQLKLREVTGVSVEGIVEASPDLPAGTLVRLGLLLTGNPAQAIAGAAAPAGEPFRILDVPPGSYQLVAIPWVPQFKDMKTVQPLQVSTQAVKDVKVLMTKSVPIAGHVQIERISATRPVSPPDPTVPRVRYEPAVGVDFNGMSPDLHLMGIINARTNAAGEVHLENALNGQTYLMNIRAPRGSYLYRVEQEGRELEGAPFPFAGGGGPVEVLLRDDGGTVDGTVRNKDSAPCAAFIVLAPKVRNKEHLYRTASAMDDGSFQLRDVAPGDYDLFALERNEYDMYFVPKYLDQFRKTAAPVSMTSSGSLHLSLELAAPSQPLR